MIPLLTKGLEDRDPDVRAAALDLLSRCQHIPDSLAPMVVRGLQEADTPPKKDRAIAAIRLLGPAARDAVPYLLANCERGVVGNEALEALELIDSSESQKAKEECWGRLKITPSS
jgi:HEAT repeat protein